MNKKGSTIFIIFMLGIVFFILGMALAPVLTNVTNEARGPSQLDCYNASISNQDKANCTSVDMLPPFFTGIVFGLAGILIGGIIIR
jgi:hypothetical protein